MAKPDCIYEFGPYRLDAGAHRLLKGDIPVKLAPKSFDLLQILIENRGRALSKSELIEAVWPDAQVEEGNLTFQMSVLRKALGSEADSWIETVPRYGYRWTAPVVVHSVTEAPAPIPADHVTPYRRRKRYLTAAALLLIAVAGGVLIEYGERAGLASSDRVSALRAVPLTAFHGVETEPAVSPDGKHVAFAWNGEKQDNFDIYVMEIASGALRRITKNPANDMTPAWSPDGRNIAFLRRLGDTKAELLLVPSAGGPEHRLGETSRAHLMGRPFELSSLAWTPDGRWVAASHREEPDLHESIYLFSLTGEKRRLTAPPADSYGDHMPAFSQNGRTLAFCRLSGYSFSEVYLQSLDENGQPAGEVRSLTDHKRWSVSPVWAPGGSEILYVLSQYGGPANARELRIAPTAGNAAPETTLNLDDEVRQISVSGGRLVYAKRREDTNIWRARIPAPGEQPEVPELLSSSTEQDGKARYSPDGTKIAFTSSRSGSQELWISNADGSNGVRLTSYGGPLIGPPAWSPDGQWLVFHARPEGWANLFVLPAAGGTPKRLTHTTSDDGIPAYSRDGRWIYFSSMRTGRLQVFRMPSAGGEAVQITKGGGTRPMESSDGRTLFYVSEAVDTIRQVPVNGGVETDVVTPLCPEFGFVVTAEALIYPTRVRSSGSCEFRLLTLATGQNRSIVRTDADRVGLTASVSHDGKYLLFEQWERSGMDLMLVDDLPIAHSEAAP